MESETEGQDEADPVPGEAMLRNWRTWLPPVLAAGVAALGIGVLAYNPVLSASVQAVACPASDSWPAPSVGVPRFTDNNVAEFVGGDYVVNGAKSQSEGLVVVFGDATIGDGHSGIANVGTVSDGSQVAPSPTAAMLDVGGSLSVPGASRLSVGAGVAGGGLVVLGGTLAPGSSVSENGGTLRQHVGSAATDQYRGFAASLATESASLAALSQTGEAALAGSTLYFTGDDRAKRQVFVVDAANLSAATTFDFKGIPSGATIVVDVTGESPVLAPTAIDMGGVSLTTPISASSAELAVHTLWNFEGAGTAQIGGSAPILGSILVPNGSATVSTDVYGRVFVARNLTRTAASVEFANYAWLGSATFSCKPQAVAIATAGQNQKAAVDTSAVWRAIVGWVLIALAILVLVLWVVRRARRGRHDQTEVGDGSP